MTKEEQYDYHQMTPPCSECQEPAVAWWPAYDPTRAPKPYCCVHLDEEKKLYTPKPPAFLQMAKERDDLII